MRRPRWNNVGLIAKLGSGACFTLMLLSPNVALAQENESQPDAPQSQDGDELDDSAIVVTAQFREQTVQDTPLAITAIGAQMLEARSQTDIREIAAQAPSVFLSYSRIGGGLVAYIRGIGQGDNSPHLEPGIGLYVDDVYLASMQGAVLNLIDLDRVEVLRGPQGTLAGKNSIGGAIKMFSKKPTGDGSGYAKVTYGSFGRIEGRTAADFALAENLFARINATARMGGGYIERIDYTCTHPNSGLPQISGRDDCKLGTMGGREYVGGRGALRWQPSSSVEVNVSADYTRDRSDPFPSQMEVADAAIFATAAANPRNAFQGLTITPDFQSAYTDYSYATFCNLNGSGSGKARCLDPTARISNWGAQGTIDVDVADNIVLKSITAYRGFTSQGAQDEDSSPFVFSNGNPGWHGTQFSQELRLNVGLMNDIANLTLGAFYLKSDITGDGVVDIPQFFVSTFKHDVVDSNSKAVYAQLEIDPIERLHLIGGIRYTKEFKGYKFFRVSTDGKQTPDPLLYDTHFAPFKGDHIDYRLNASFDVTDAMMAYAQYATGFKGGGLNATPFFANQVFGFDPETLNTIEAGVKSQLFDRRVTLNLAGYYSNYKNIQLGAQTCPPPATPSPCSALVNAGAAHVKGLEIETNMRPIPGLMIDGSLSLLDFNYYRLSNTTLTLNNIPPNTPKVSWSGGIQYEVQLGDGGSITPRLDAQHRADVFSSIPNTPANIIPARTIFNARLTWANAKNDVNVALEVTNLTDKYYDESLNVSTLFGTAVHSAAPPRRWAVTVTKEF